MMSSIYITSDLYKSDPVTVGLDMNVEIKSEAESDNDSPESISSSVEETHRPTSQYQSDNDLEDLEDEPLVEIDAITVPQELVEVELEPSLLLFVNRDPKINGTMKTVTPKHDFFPADAPTNTVAASTEKCLNKSLEEEVGDKMSITKALRNVKRKILPNRNSVELKRNLESSLTKTGEKTINEENCPDDPPSPCDSSSDHNDDKGRIPLPPPLRRKTKNKIISRKHVKSKKKKCFEKSKPEQPAEKKRNSTKQMKSWKYLMDSFIDDTLLSVKETKHEKDTPVTDKESCGEENAQKIKEDLKESVFISEGDKSLVIANNVKQNKIKRGHQRISIEDKKPIKMLKPDSFDCMVCGKKFREKSHLATHSRAHIDIRNYKCNECGNLFKTKTNLYFHMKTHEEAPFICEKCNKTFAERKVLMRHIRVVHSGEGSHNCDQCGRSFKSAHNLDLHYTLHTGNKPFSCNVCGKSFVYKSTYTAHMKAHDADDMFSCELCPSNAFNKGELRRRCNHHSEARPWLCTVCGKGYPLKGTLKNHMKTHEPEKPHKCNECGKSFMKKQSYECHMKMHAGENPQYMCDQCSLSYFNVFALKRHYIKHTSERRFVCDICNKAFWMKDALKVHRRSHESLKMFHCTQCSKAFAHKHTLVAHMRTHSSEQSYSCAVCPKTFIHKYNLDRHERQHSMPPTMPPPPTSLPLPPSLIMMAPPKHLEFPTLHIL